MNQTKHDLHKLTPIKQRIVGDYYDFIDDAKIWEQLNNHKIPTPFEVNRIIQKSLNIETLLPDEVSTLLHVDDDNLWQQMFKAAGEVKRKVYDNRIVTFAPLYCSSVCVNNCQYCGFRTDNKDEIRKTLSIDEVIKETEVLAGKIGHKRIIAVYGESAETNADYIAETIRAIYNVKVQKGDKFQQIRRVNVNAAPMTVEDYRKIKDAGIGTYQVFQETYHHDTYNYVHPKGTLKNNYLWRLTCTHRAFEAGIDDVALGILVGLYDWRFEVMGLLYHSIELEKRFNGVGPHTISFPRLQNASNAPYIQESKYKVSDEDFLKLITVIRLAVPYTGMIVTARESVAIRNRALELGCTQTDASPHIGIGGYSAEEKEQNPDEQQFILGDTRSLDELVRDLAKNETITSFCTAGYRCSRTGGKIMDMLRCGKESSFCKINAILTYKEWLDDFASDETKAIADNILQKEIKEIKNNANGTYSPQLVKLLDNYYQKIEAGERDLFV